jgi:hypothetical protein
MAAKDKDDALKRLGGGRWQTRDGRFTIEPQGGSWVVVDGEQTDDLGLPLVRGPFTSLGAAREAIDAARTGETPVSPLAGRIDEAADRPRPTRDRPARSTRAVKGPATAASTGARGKRPSTSATPETTRAADEPPGSTAAAPPPSPDAPGPAAPPPPPPEPDWIGSLRPAERMAARALLARLESAGVPGAAEVARSEIVAGEPAVARVALRNALAAAIAEGGDAERLAARLVALLADGGDEALGIHWRLVDEDGRPIGDPLADR